MNQFVAPLFNRSIQLLPILLFIVVHTVHLTAWTRSPKSTRKPAQVETFYAKVQSCHDGDTCRFQTDRSLLKVRLWGIDAPEKKQEFGAEAQKYTLSLLKDQDVRLDCVSQSFDRKVCKVFINEQMVQRQIVAAGFAWDEVKFSKGEFSSDMKAAQRQKLGLWKNPQARKPSQFRKDK